MAELTGMILKQMDEQRAVFAPVLVPNEADSDGDVVKAEKIESVAHGFMESYGNIDLQHTLNNVGKVIESYIAPADLEINDFIVPKGTWMMGVRVTDDDAWQAVKSGKLTGFSIMGIRSSVMKSAKSNEEIEAATKRTTLADLGDDWVVNSVSLVDEPAVPKAKFLVIKAKEQPPEQKGIMSKIKKFFSEPVEASSSKTEKSQNEGGSQMDDMNQLTEIMKSAFKEALKEHEESKQQADEVQQEALSVEDIEEEATPTEPQITIAESEYEELQKSKEELFMMSQEVEKLTEAVGKSFDFYSKRLIGQEKDVQKNKNNEIEPTRDAFGYRINK